MYSGTDKKRFMTFGQFQKIIDETSVSFELQLEGGEPLLHPQFFLFLEYAISYGRCNKINVLTNGFLLQNAFVKRILDFSHWNEIPVEFKVSVNYWLMQQDPEHLQKLANLAFALAWNPRVSLRLNVRKRKTKDEWIDEEIAKLHLSNISNSFYLQSYGKMSGSTEYDGPVIVQNIEEWEIYASDGTSFGQDLVARSEYEGKL